MTRPLRLEFPGAVYHITARGDGREEIFLDDADRQRFLDLLAREVQQQRWRLYAYCLMGNHYHLLLETPEANLVAGMRRLNGVYTQAFNRRHGRVGHVLQGRYKSILVDRDSYLLELCRYVVLNPVRAGLVKRPEDWAWSSYRATVGKVAAPGWLRADWVLAQFGEDPAAARQAYQRFVRAGIGAESPWQKLRSQIYLGSDDFLARMERLAAASEVSGVPRGHRLPARPNPDGLLEEVCRIYRCSAEDVRRRSHQPAFQSWVYLLRRAANLGLRETAALAGVSAPRISQIQRVFDQEPPAALARLLTKYKVKA
ncbi:MAG: transposase [Burkholderiales bacterium]